MSHLFRYCILASFFLLISSDQAPYRFWVVSDPILLPGKSGSFDETAVKDPSILYAEGKWHLFYTARGQNEYTTAYISADSLEKLQEAPRFTLKQIRGKSPYGCAPQVFYFSPQEKWYLIFQSRDSNYQPAFSTTNNISDPQSWSKPAGLIKKDAKEKWIDFWVIADSSNAYLFYTQAHDSIMVRSTALEDFPHGWGPASAVLDQIHEAVHVYKVQNSEKYHLIYELNHDGIRSFGLAEAEHLSGPWQKVNENYANGRLLHYNSGQEKWTDMVSHGEIIRSGNDQFLEYDPENTQILIQGILSSKLKQDYADISWKLGLIKEN